MKKFLSRFLLLLVGLLVLLVAANFLFLDFVVDMAWHHSLGLLRLFLLKLGYRYLLLGLATATFFLLVFVNFWVASRYLGVNLHNQGGEPGSTSRRIIRAFRTGSMRVYTPLSLVMALFLAMPFYREWENALLFFFAPATGTRDALFGLDISFYLFALPLIRLVQGRLILTVLLMLASLVVLYAAEMRVLAPRGHALYRGAKIHLSVVVFLIFLLMSGGYVIEALMLQYSDSNAPLFHGPGYAEVQCILPLIGLSAALLPLAALALILYINTRRGFKFLVAFGTLTLLTHLARDWKALPNAVNKYRVRPNELATQFKHMDSSIQATLASYNLLSVERRDHARLHDMPGVAELGMRTDLENIPLWDNELLGDVFQEVQAIRPYYQFSEVDVSRYAVGGQLHQVYLAAREISVKGLPESARNWVNERLKYTHGYGVVMVPAAQRGEERMRWFIRDMPPRSEVGFRVGEPSIYYGTGDAGYILAPNKSQEFHYPGSEVEALIDYQGKGGVRIGRSLWRRLLFSVYFKDLNLFLTPNALPATRIHFRRNIQERLRILTPFLELDHDPYLVVTSERLYWIQDAYTRSSWYPNATSYDGKHNYIRNSVKIVVDAYDGSVRYYLAEPTDPIARAYQRMYPGLIRPLADMPPDLRAQIRYPRDLFEIQMGIYSIYHQTNPETFYKGEDRMQFAEIFHRDALIRMQPNYLTLDILEHGKPEFLLLTPMLPMNRDNLRALAVAGCDGDNYGKIFLYTFPKGSQVFGPPQINALIDQNTEIAENITLWNQQGSEVVRGKMIVLPLGKHILYIQPLYMEATGRLRIPQLKRIIVSAEETVVMDMTLEQAMDKLRALLERQSDAEPLDELAL